MNNTLFIEPNFLKNKLNDTTVKILDATFFLPDSGLDAEKEYKKEHIPNSVFFDVNKIADPKNPLPHMIPSKHLFSDCRQVLIVCMISVVRYKLSCACSLCHCIAN